MFAIEIFAICPHKKWVVSHTINCQIGASFYFCSRPTNPMSHVTHNQLPDCYHYKRAAQQKFSKVSVAVIWSKYMRTPGFGDFLPARWDSSQARKESAKKTFFLDGPHATWQKFSKVSFVVIVTSITSSVLTFREFLPAPWKFAASTKSAKRRLRHYDFVGGQHSPRHSACYPKPTQQVCVHCTWKKLTHAYIHPLKTSLMLWVRGWMAQLMPHLSHQPDIWGRFG